LQGLLDHGQVSYLETLENEDDPDFIENIFTLFLRDSSKYIASIEKAL
jgi:histidine-containing phosphotransfer protein